jgi:sterol desaturase/sphingolipid hydroxylase (fatty acid hydroxylase superfamily)
MAEFVLSQPMWLIALATATWFLILYFGAGGLVSWAVNSVLPRRGYGRVIDERPPRPGQIREEVGNSLVAIGIFAIYGMLTIKALESGLINVDWTPNWALLPLEILVLTLWNELHFFACHRLLHTKWLFRTVHHAHHRSVVTTPYSTYSMHWFEAVLLGSVMITAMAMHAFSYVALACLPLISILINVVSHSNYELFPNAPEGSLRAAARRHGGHHSRSAATYGFLMPMLDRLFGGAAVKR